MTGKYNNHIVMAVGDVFDANNTNEEPNRDAMIERLMPKLIASGDVSGNWAEDMENYMELTLQGEYITPNSPIPAPTSLTS